MSISKWAPMTSEIRNSRNISMAPKAGNGTGASTQLKFVRDREHIRHVPKEYTLEDIQKHNNPYDCWIKIDDSVFDVTPYLSFHPGGSEVILGTAGKDATTAFKEAHPWVAYEAILSSCKIGFIKSSKPVGILEKMLFVFRGGTS